MKIQNVSFNNGNSVHKSIVKKNSQEQSASNSLQMYSSNQNQNISFGFDPKKKLSGFNIFAVIAAFLALSICWKRSISESLVKLQRETDSIIAYKTSEMKNWTEETTQMIGSLDSVRNERNNTLDSLYKDKKINKSAVTSADSSLVERKALLQQPVGQDLNSLTNLYKKQNTLYLDFLKLIQNKTKEISKIDPEVAKKLGEESPLVKPVLE